MIKVVKNPSFEGYYEIFNEQVMVDEVQGRNKAKRTAIKLARKLKLSFIIFLGENIHVEQ